MSARSIVGYSRKEKAILNERKTQQQVAQAVQNVRNNQKAAAAAFHQQAVDKRRGPDDKSYSRLAALARSGSASTYVPGAPSSLKRMGPSFKSAPAHIQRYVEMMLNVHDSDPIQAPSPVPFRSTPTKQIITSDIATNYCTINGAAQFYGECQPNMDNTLLLTTPTASLEVANSAAYSGDFWGVAGTGAGSAMAGGYMYSSSSSNILVSGTTLEGGSVTNQTCFPLVNTNNTAIPTTFNFQTLAPLDEPITVGIQALVGSTWSSIGSVIVAGGTATTGGVSLPANTIAINFTVAANELGDREFLRINFSFLRASGAGQWRMGVVPKNVTPYETTILTQVAQLQYSRVTALDVLGTFQGATMTDGGLVAAARVPKFWSSASSNGYSDIILLPYDSYDGEIKHGFHVHWVPTSLDDITPTIQIGQFDSFGSTKLVFGGTVNTAGQSVRIRTSIVVEYFSTAPSYGPMSWTPPPNDMALALYYVATQIPAATSNREHIVKKLGNLGGKYLGLALSYLKQHPEMILEIGSAIAAAIA